MKKIITFFIIMISFSLLFVNVKAASNTYKTNYEILNISDIGKSMVESNISNDIYIEKNDDVSYLYLKVFDKENIQSLSLSIDDDYFGFYEYNEYYMYSINTSNLFQNITVSGYIPAMNSIISFNIRINSNLEEVAFATSDYKPALYMPKLEYNGKEYYNVALNTNFIFPNAKAYLGNTELEIKYYLNDKLVNITSYTFEKEGKYTLKLLFESDLYKDSNNKNTFVFIDITLNVIKNTLYGGKTYVATNGAKIKDINNEIFVQANIVSVNHKIGDMYYEIKSKLNSYNNFNIVYINIVDNNNEIIDLAMDVSVEIPVDKTINYNNFEAYYYDGYELIKLDGKKSITGYNIETNNLGYFVIKEIKNESFDFILIIIPILSLIIILSGVIILRRRNHEK